VSSIRKAKKKGKEEKDQREEIRWERKKQEEN
jgi:hypothetical protein